MNICKFWQFLGKILSCLLQLLVSVTTFFLEIMMLRYAFSEKQKYIEKINIIRIIALLIEIFAVFGNFSANFCLVHSSCWFYDQFLA